MLPRNINKRRPSHSHFLVLVPVTVNGQCKVAPVLQAYAVHHAWCLKVGNGVCIGGVCNCFGGAHASRRWCLQQCWC